MKPIIFKNDDGTSRAINPLFVIDVVTVAPDYSDNWCLVLNLNVKEGQNNVFTRLYKTKEELDLVLEYVYDCMKMND